MIGYGDLPSMLLPKQQSTSRVPDMDRPVYSRTTRLYHSHMASASFGWCRGTLAGTATVLMVLQEHRAPHAVASSLRCAEGGRADVRGAYGDAWRVHDR